MRDSRQFQRVKGRDTEPRCSLSQNGYGHRRGGKTRRGRGMTAVPGQGSVAKEDTHRIPCRASRRVQRAPKSWPSFCGRANFSAEFFKARMPRLKKLGEELRTTSKTRPDCLAHPEQFDRGFGVASNILQKSFAHLEQFGRLVRGVPNNPAEFLASCPMPRGFF